jgi:thioredoxin 2
MSLNIDERGVLVQCPNCGTRNRLPFTSLEKRIRCGQCKNELPPVNAPVEIGSAGDFRAISSLSALPVLVDFWAAWCGPCKMLAPELEKVATAGAGKFLVAKLNTEQVPQVAAEFQISSIPNLVLLNAGREVNRLAGARPASDILRFVETNIR